MITIMPHLSDNSLAVSIIIVCFAIFEKMNIPSNFSRKQVFSMGTYGTSKEVIRFMIIDNYITN